MFTIIFYLRNRSVSSNIKVNLFKKESNYVLKSNVLKLIYDKENVVSTSYKKSFYFSTDVKLLLTSNL